MPNNTSHSLQSKTEEMPDLADFADGYPQPAERHYLGEVRAKWLIPWLEKNRTKAAGKRVADLLRDMGAAQGMVQPNWGIDAQGGGMTCELRKGAVDPSFTRFQQQVASINRRLSRYRLYPEVWFGALDNPSSWQVSWRPSRQQRGPSQVVDSESAAVGLLLNLARQGVVHRVRECLNCGRWFFARFEHSKFCQRKCQLKHYQSDPKWKTHRREWMRGYRETQERRRRAKAGAVRA
jgi:hypothetical protein